MARKSRIEREYSYQMHNLRRYYSTRSQDRKPESLEQAKAFAWRKAIKQVEAETSKEMLATIKHVYILKDRCLAVASQSYLNYSERHARRLVREWFERLDQLYHLHFFALLEENHAIKSILQDIQMATEATGSLEA